MKQDLTRFNDSAEKWDTPSKIEKAIQYSEVVKNELKK